MFRDSSDQIFSRVTEITARAARLLGGADAPPPPDGSAHDREAPRGAAAHDRGAPRGAAAIDLEALSLAAGAELRLPQLTQLFGLSPLAIDLLICLTAAEYEPLLRTVQRALQRELGRPWLELGTVAELLGLPARRLPDLARLLEEDAPLRRFGLCRVDESAGEVPLISLRLKLNPRVAQHLLGQDALAPPLHLTPAPHPLEQSLVPAAATDAVLLPLRAALQSSDSLLVELIGPPGCGKAHLAEGLALTLGAPLLVLDLAEVPRGALAAALCDLRRETRLRRALPCLRHLETVVAPPGAPAAPPSSGEDGEGPQGAAPSRRLPLALEQHLRELDGPLLVTAPEREPLLGRLGVDLLHVIVPFPSPSQRAVLLDAALRERGVAVPAEVDLLAAARRFALDPGAIRSAAREAAVLAQRHQPAVLLPTDLRRACQHLLRHELQSLAMRVSSNHRWEDLVISEDVLNGLNEMVAYVRHGQLVYEQWGFAARHSLPGGVSALFSGPPGTGKTMCASVMARELDMELFRVDLSRVVSKWIGETEKNLARVFDEAQRSAAIILFDEADSLFAKRTDVKSSVDRYANLEVNFLLQRMEAFTGVTILTTNFEDTLDTAFKRRLTFRLRFEKPNPQARVSLWQKAFPALCQLAEDVDAEQLAQRFEMSGGNIRNAALRAAFLAAERGGMVDMAACMTAAEREAREMGLLTYEAQLQLAQLREAQGLDSEPPPVQVVSSSSQRVRAAWPWARET